MTVEATGGLERVEALIRDVPDYPKPGVLFKDITPVLADPDALRTVVEALADPWRGRVDKVVGIEARGFILAAPVALSLGVGFVPVRKAGKLPADRIARSYALEYGEATVEMHRDALQAGERVVIVDDVLATGGTVEATVGLVEAGGGDVQGVSMLLELTFLHGRERLGDLDVRAILTA